MSELKMPQVGASRSEIVANWQPENPVPSYQPQSS